MTKSDRKINTPGDMASDEIMRIFNRLEARVMAFKQDSADPRALRRITERLEALSNQLEVR